MTLKSIANPSTYERLARGDKLQIIIRGESFRSTVEKQHECIDSIIKMIIKPLVESGLKLEVNLCLYQDDRNDQFVNKFYDSGLVTNVHRNDCSKKDITSQSDSLNYGLSFAHSTNVLVIRPDLNIRRKIQISSLSRNNFHFQWNYFHDYNIKEVPDQVHFIGESVLNEVKGILLENKDNLGILPNGQGIGTLHNIYNVLYEHKFYNISFIIEYVLDDNCFEGSYCKLRGNPLVSKLNDFYTYERIIEKKRLYVRCIEFILRKLNHK